MSGRGRTPTVRGPRGSHRAGIRHRHSAADRRGCRRLPALPDHEGEAACLRRARPGERADGTGCRVPRGRHPRRAALRVLGHDRLGRPARRFWRHDRPASRDHRRRSGARRHPHQPIRREAGSLGAGRRGAAFRLPDLLRRRPGGLPADHLDGGAALRRVAPLVCAAGRRGLRRHACAGPATPRPGRGRRNARGRHRADAARRCPRGCRVVVLRGAARVSRAGATRARRHPRCPVRSRERDPRRGRRRRCRRRPRRSRAHTCSHATGLRDSPRTPAPPVGADLVRHGARHAHRPPA